MSCCATTPKVHASPSIASRSVAAPSVSRLPTLPSAPQNQTMDVAKVAVQSVLFTKTGNAERKTAE